MLNVLQHKDVGDVMLVVIRYFGGIKLGAGGLVRAYSQAAQLAITELPTQFREMLYSVTVAVDFAQEQPLRHWLSGCGGNVVDVDYQQQVMATLSLPESCVADLKGFLAARNGRIIGQP